jgi:cation diffusion facilitator family transporter
MASAKCIACARRTPWYCLLGNSFLSAFQILIGIISGSGALVADGSHTFTDVIGTVSVLLSRTISENPPDEEHSYGHGKVEFMSSTFVYVILVFLSAAIFAGGAMMIIHNRYRQPEPIALLASCLSILVNGLMFKLGQCSGKRSNSPALIANAFENKADAMSAAAVFVGVGASILIHPIFDPIAAMLVGLHIFVNAVKQLKDATGGLIDASLSPEVVKRIKLVARGQAGVLGLDFVKTRQTGTKYWVDVGIRVDGKTNVCESEAIAAAVRTELMRRSEKLASVEVFVAPQPVRLRPGGAEPAKS